MNPCFVCGKEAKGISAKHKDIRYACIDHLQEVSLANQIFVDEVCEKCQEKAGGTNGI